LYTVQQVVAMNMIGLAFTCLFSELIKQLKKIKQKLLTKSNGIENVTLYLDFENINIISIFWKSAYGLEL